MFKLIALAAAALATQALPPPSSPLIGVWIEVSGPGIARIAPCPDRADQLCATGLARRPGQPMAETGLVMSGIKAAGQNRWRGTYHHGRQTLPATLRLTGGNQVQMKVCLFLLCQSASYARD